MNIYIGIDNGINGGIAIIADDGNNIEVIKMPSSKVDGRGQYNKKEIIKIFDDKKLLHDDIHIGLEKAQPRFRDGSKQAFGTGFGYGLIQGILKSLGFNYEIIPPKEWQYNLFQSKKIKDTKAESIKFCKVNFPNVSLLATERSRVPHDGMSDALCIAEYMRRKNED